MKMIRRELPSDYSRGSRCSCRMATREGSPFEAMGSGSPRCSSPGLVAWMGLGHLCDCPDEAGEFSGDGDDGLSGAFATLDQARVFAMEPSFSFASDGKHFGRLTEASFREFETGTRAVAIVPGGFHQDTSQVGVASPGDGALAALSAAAVFAGDQAGGAHELGGFGKAAQVSDFGDDGQRRSCGDAAQGLEAGSFGGELGVVCGLLEEPIESSDLLEPFGDGRLVLLEDGLGMGLGKVDRLNPAPVALRPGLAVPVTVAISKKELAEPVTTPQQVDLRIFSSADQVSQRFLSLVRNPDQSQLSGPVQASELVSVSAVRLDSISRPAR